MASEIKVTPESEEMWEKEGPESPGLDLSDAAVMGSGAAECLALADGCDHCRSAELVRYRFS